MPLPLTTSAPGKLFLVGEYAVLDGAPALLTAVDVRAEVRADAAADGIWRVSAPNLGIKDLALGENAMLPHDTLPPLRARLAVFDAVRETVFAVFGAPSQALAITIDTGDFARGAYKLGLGSSAAVAAALTQTLVLASGHTLSRERLAELAIAAHRSAQGGTGSGGDVAVSVHGGLIAYERDRAPRALAWPSDLIGWIVVTGEGASTADLVARVRAYGERDPERYADDIARLNALADKAQHALTDADAWLGLTDAYFEALQQLDAHAEAGIVDARHRTLHAVAARHEAVFKTSGAGGGDVGLVFARRDGALAALRSDFAAEHAVLLDHAFGAPGVQTTST